MHTANGAVNPHKLALQFRDRFGHEAQVFQAPGRINIIGEHTDYNDGLVLPAAIGRYCAVAAAPTRGRSIRVVSPAYGEAEIDLADNAPTSVWSDYIAGVVQVLRGAGVLIAGADLLIASDIPVGAGLSSSAALEVAVALTLLKLGDHAASPVEIAKWAQRAENEFVGVPCGIMDQYASADGAAGCAKLIDCRSLDTEIVPVPPDAAFLLIDTMTRHAHAEGAYRTLWEECENAAAAVGVPALRDIDEAGLNRALSRLSGNAAKRCRHVVTENARVHETVTALRGGDIARVGHLINASHASLSGDMEVSTPAIDRLVAMAQETDGVLGARLMGGGFGGCILVLTRKERAESVLARLQEAFTPVVGAMPNAFECDIVGGAHEVKL